MLSAYWEISCSRRESQIASFITPRSFWKYKRLPLASYVRWPTNISWRECLIGHLISIIHTQQPGFRLTDSQTVWILEFLSISWSRVWAHTPWSREIILFLPVTWISFVVVVLKKKTWTYQTHFPGSLETRLVGKLIRLAWSISSCVAVSALAFKCHLALPTKISVWQLRALTNLGFPNVLLRVSPPPVLQMKNYHHIERNLVRHWRRFPQPASRFFLFLATQDWNLNCSTTDFNSWCPERPWFIN